MAVVYLDGKFYDKREDAKISVWDHGLLYGDGIFEGIRVYNGRIFKSKEHLRRLYDCANTLRIDIPMDMDEMEKLMIETIRRSKMTDCYIRLLITRGVGDLGLDPRRCSDPSVIIIVDKINLFPAELYEEGVKVITAATRKNHPACINPNIKSLNYLNNIFAKMEANHAGVSEAIQMNLSGHVCEGSADNIFVIRDGILKTPPPNDGVLIGITRNTVMELAEELGIEVRETSMTSHDLYSADELFLTGTAAEMIPVIAVDNRRIGSGKPGPIFRKILDKLKEVTRSEGTAVFTPEEMENLKTAVV